MSHRPWSRLGVREWKDLPWNDRVRKKLMSNMRVKERRTLSFVLIYVGLILVTIVIMALQLYILRLCLEPHLF
jgi:hypothetical protein